MTCTMHIDEVIQLRDDRGNGMIWHIRGCFTRVVPSGTAWFMMMKVVQQRCLAQ